MKVTLAFATADAALLAYLDRNRKAVVPRELSDHGFWKERQARFSVQINHVDHRTSVADLGCWLRRLAPTTSALVLIVDEVYRGLVHDFEDAYFVVSRPQYPGKNIQNEMRALLAPVLRHFAAYVMRFNSFRNQRILLLPFDIFQADELNELRERLTLGKMEPDLAYDLDELLRELNERAKPKTKQRRFGNGTAYLVDDRPLFYRYGPEHHALPETGIPPHQEKCWHNSQFRFGCIYDAGLHHNVDDGNDPSRASGNFVNCHGDVLQVSGKTHLNVFPNGHI